MERCPICRGRINEAMQCCRCGADLQLASQTQNDAERLTERAMDCLCLGDFEQARKLLLKVVALRDSVFIRQLLAFTESERASVLLCQSEREARGWFARWFRNGRN
ncbi:MAG TPA: hypothetical protein ENK06_07395 [Gammaproteobacteria bacterium]|nr:hypothetical protein [Gammaproteobacteria bacterium]